MCGVRDASSALNILLRQVLSLNSIHPDTLPAIVTDGPYEYLFRLLADGSMYITR
jgi:hypothetical protein